MECKICSSTTQSAFSAEVMAKHTAEFVRCPKCEYIFAAEPFWLEEAYQESITHADTGLLARNIDFSRKISLLLYHYFDRDGSFLDYAGGYGLFTRLMRDVGFNFYHTDPYTQNLFAREYEWDASQMVSALTCFECFEHLPEPMDDIRKMLSIAPNLLVSTELLPSTQPSLDWHYYAFEHGQHISFYSAKTMQHIASEFGLSLVSVGSLHFFTADPLPSRKVRRMVRGANRSAYFLSRKTKFEKVVRKMRKQ